MATRGSDRGWWRQSRITALAIFVAGAGLSLLSMLFGASIGGDFLGIPFDLFGTTVIAPLCAIFAIFWSARQQRRIDRAHGVFED